MAKAGGSTDSVLNQRACRAEIQKYVKRLYDMMECDRENCEDSDHKRHHEFVADYGIVCEREHYTRGFGKKYFEADVQSHVYDMLNGELLTTNQRESRTIKKLPACLLKQTLQHPGLAECYIKYVCVKECMIWIKCSLHNSPYEVANEQLSATEFYRNKK